MNPTVATVPAFLAGLFVFGLVALSFPDEAALLGLAVILGAVIANEKDAAARGIPGPLAELGVIR